ncbi:uncharacterized protein BCR38DRAFT_527629 [Pseudomassariella vexata]|uniref:Uncharacterized protein n=1 Tax=Pseudomassariella vexata TaxID=1141098 RepID=A0A1Y2DG27_9PEZI|nr:uncharacterized protein BCR38DRAFT_527629 [Pseudomassariella vexata]ORY58066.1 hypothetical protein BCR38DRAFT_527629 [Pseudomassariella vexata]
MATIAAVLLFSFGMPSYSSFDSFIRCFAKSSGSLDVEEALKPRHMIAQKKLRAIVGDLAFFEDDDTDFEFGFYFGVE